MQRSRAPNQLANKVLIEKRIPKNARVIINELFCFYTSSSSIKTWTQASHVDQWTKYAVWKFWLANNLRFISFKKLTRKNSVSYVWAPMKRSKSFDEEHPRPCHRWEIALWSNKSRISRRQPSLRSYKHRFSSCSSKTCGAPSRSCCI